MTTIQITLPDQLAQDAERAGLLSPESLERLLREQLRSKSASELFSAMERMSASDAMPPMTAEEVAGEIAAMRSERRTKRA